MKLSLRWEVQLENDDGEMLRNDFQHDAETTTW